MYEEFTYVMSSDPAPNISVEEMNIRAKEAKTGKELADAYAMASNKAWWVEDDDYDYEEGTKEYEDARRITCAWFAVTELLRNKIRSALEAEGVIVPERGYLETLKPFMERNGYYFGRGWWVTKEQIEKNRSLRKVVGDL